MKPINKAHEMAQLCDDSYSTEYKFRKAQPSYNVKFHSAKGGTQLYTVWSDTDLIFVFRGTEATDWNDIKADLKFRKVPRGTKGCAVHRGFADAFDVAATMVAKDYEELSEGRRVTFTGHSLGGALATLAMANVGKRSDELYTFGSPRVGNARWCHIFEYKFPNCWRYRNQNDVVTREPARLIGYRHVGKFMYFDGVGELHENPSLELRLKEFAIGMFKDKTDLFKDHFMRNYVYLTERNQ
jgi:triacylglycerol lipase